MVSYRLLESGQVVLHERETTSSGRPKPLGRWRDDQYFWYEYDSRGGLKSKNPKSAISQYAYWHKHNVKFDENKRITPLTEFEKRLGVSMSAKPIQTVWYNGRKFTSEQWAEFVKRPDQWVDMDNDPATPPRFDYGNAEYYYSSDLPQKGKQAKYANWSDYFIQKAKDNNLIVTGEADSDLGNILHLNFKEKPNPALIEKVRPNPKDVKLCLDGLPMGKGDCCRQYKDGVCVRHATSNEVEPIEEAVKYSPLMIAGVIAVVVILLLKRRRA